MDCSLRTSFSLAAIWHHNHALMHGLCPLYVMAYVSHNTSDRAESVLHSQDVYKEYYFYMAMHPPLSHSKTIFLVVAVLLKYSCKPTALKQFNADVREHFASFKTDDVLSLDQFMDEAASEDGKGFEPASPEYLEETVMLRMIIQDLLKKIHEINPKYGRILDLICEDYTKGQILDELGLGKSQGYADIKAAQALAKKLYFGE